MTGPPAPVSREQLLAGTPPDRAAETAGVAREVARSGRRLVVLDDDPTGTQTVAGLPVLTRWAGDDLRWAFGQQAAAFFVLTNSRSLAPGEMARVNREVVAAVAAAAPGRRPRLRDRLAQRLHPARPLPGGDRRAR